jgi:peptidoglycan-N-acetylglucosamine deacetylase
MPKSIVRGNPDIPNIALTFDDGPGEITRGILDVLQRHKVKATFFCLGYRIQPGYDYNNARIESLMRAHAEGHHIGIHGLYHEYFNRLRDDVLSNDLSLTIKWVEELIGETPKYIRPPGGMTDDRANEVSDSFGLMTILWGISPMEWEHYSVGGRDNPCQPYKLGADEIYSGIMKDPETGLSPENGVIFVCHDGWEIRWEGNNGLIPALDRAIPELQRRGFKFVTIDELLATGNYITRS